MSDAAEPPLDALKVMKDIYTIADNDRTLVATNLFSYAVPIWPSKELSARPDAEKAVFAILRCVSRALEKNDAQEIAVPEALARLPEDDQRIALTIARGGINHVVHRAHKKHLSLPDALKDFEQAYRGTEDNKRAARARSIAIR